MVKEDIIRGLEGAMSKGESLERAMYSFYNAGYRKDDVEEAARAMSIHLSQQESLIPMSPLSFIVKSEPVKPREMQVQIPQSLEPPIEIQKPKPVEIYKPKTVEMPKPKVEEIIPKPNIKPVAEKKEAGLAIREKPKVVQEVSKYEQKQKTSPRTILIVVLSIILLVLFLSLGGLFIFKDSVLSFFNGIF